MTEIEAVAQLRKWAEEDRTQADAIEYLDAVVDDGPSLSGSQAAGLRETADGWDAIADIVEQQAPSS